MVKPVRLKENAPDRKERTIRNLEINTILYLLFYFFVYSIVGWMLESSYRSLIERKLINSGFLHGPYCPIYGFGAVIMFLFLDGFEDNIILLFVMGFLVLSAWEYVVGVLLEKVYHTKYWDYSHSRFNIHGRVCLLNSIYWGILGVIFIKIIHPFVQDLTLSIPYHWLVTLDVSLLAIFVTDFIISNGKIKGIDKQLAYLKEITETIKEKIKEIKKAREEDIKNEEIIQTLKEALDELKQKQDILKMNLYKQSIRLKKAFPTIQSDKINEILKKEIDLNVLKNRIHKKNKESKK